MVLFAIHDDAIRDRICMILSSDHKFVFIKGRKVASTSVEVMLSKICGPDDIITPITPIDERRRLLDGGRVAQNYGADESELSNYLTELKSRSAEDVADLKIPRGKYRNHMPLKWVISKFGSIPDDWTILAVERCPYRKIISLANMELRFNDYRKNGDTMVSDLDSLRTQINMMFESESIVDVRNIDLYRNENSEIRANIFRYERLGEDINQFLSTLAVDEIPKLEHFKKGVSDKQIDLRSVFTTCQIKRINELFEDEFTHFGYSMIY